MTSTVLRFTLLITFSILLAACTQVPRSSDIDTQYITENQKLPPLTPSFGWSIAVDGDFMVVGAPRISVDGRGKAYLYQKDPSGNWQFLKELIFSGQIDTDYFGYDVAISGTTIIIGAPFTPINGVSTLPNPGAAIIFERDQGGINNWGQVKKLTVPASDLDLHSYADFGASVSINGDIIVVGVPYDQVGDNLFQGSAYIFSRNRGGINAWGRVKQITASDGEAGSVFGYSVSISKNTIAVGAIGGALRPTINQLGVTYIFERNQGSTNNWGEVKKIINPNGEIEDNFASSVSISGNTLVIGAPGTNINSITNQGIARIYERNYGGSNNWGEVQVITSTFYTSNPIFGKSVYISGDTIIVGAPGAQNSRGSAHIFSRNRGGSNQWGQVVRLIASDRNRGYAFGQDVAISENTALVSTGNFYTSGSAYIFNY